MPAKIRHRQHAVKSNPLPPRTVQGNALSVLVVQIMQLNGLLLDAGDALAAPAGQTSARWQILAAVEDAPRSVADIARSMNLARQSVQRIADLLVEDGLGSYEENPAHVRAKLLCLTASGCRTLARIQAAQARWANELAAELDLEQLRVASDLLDRLKLRLRTVRGGA